MRKNKVQKFVSKALTKLFQAVGFEKFDSEFVNLHESNWFQLRAWSNDAEKKFKSWLIQEMRKDLKISKKRAESESNWFLLSYGWKNKE